MNVDRGSKTGTLVVGTMIGIFTIFDSLLVGIPILGLATLYNPLIVFAIALVVLIAVNVAACTWVDYKWDAWIIGTRFEAKMQEVRSGKRARKPVEWLSRGSNLWFGVTAALLNAVQVIALTRLITRSAAGPRRILVASAAYSFVFVGLFSRLGGVLGEVFRAVFAPAAEAA